MKTVLTVFGINSDMVKRSLDLDLGGQGTLGDVCLIPGTHI